MYKLLAWSSPGYPTGAFSYSHGLEWAVETGDVKNLQSLLDYVTAVLSRGGGWVDTVLFAHAWRSASAAVDTTTALAGSTAVDATTALAASTAVDATTTLAASTAVDATTALAASTAVDATTALADRSTPAVSAPVDPTTPTAFANLDTLTQLAAAFRGSAETALESRQQGGAFLDVTRKAWPHPLLDAFAARQARAGTPVAHCIAVAVACAAHAIALAPALHSYIHAVAANLVSAGARLIPLGQTQAQIAIAQLAPVIANIAGRAQVTSLDDLGTAAPAIELCSLRHETQYTRLFRS
jgi:urease accessory protein UreF